MRVKRYMRRYRREERMTLTGPNCAGTISPGKAMMGIMPGHIYMPGNVGLIGRSGTLGYEAASQMKALGIGISAAYLSMTPYLITIIVMVIMSADRRRASMNAPASLGRIFHASH